MKHVRRSSPILIVALTGTGIVLGSLLRPVSERLNGSAPQPSWAAALTLFLGAMVIGGLAWNMWQALHKKKQRMTSDYGIRMLALAKSCVAVGALVGGGYAGFALAFLENFNTPLGRERVLYSAAAAVAALLLLIAALLLEKACQIPGSDDDDDPQGSGAATT